MKMPRLLRGLLFEDSRKFGTGLWVLLLGTVLLFCEVNYSDWLIAVGIAAGLIGGGTIADTYLGKKRKTDDPPPPAQ
jgi:hypothetical protein